ncbi:MAG: biopolymer transporter Tol, partial [Candidatus Latescibacterota bacterium]
MRRLASLLLVCWAAAASGQNHPELDWRVIETPHFRVLFHQGLEDAAQRAARIAEEAYGPITGLYDYRPDGPVRIVLKDCDDYANGAAFYYQDAIEIWATALEHDFELRGTSDWLRNVITHEYTHIISLGAARRAPQSVPAAYLQYFGYKQERDRDDILVGYPDLLLSYPVMGTSVPMWFAEGVAQYMAAGAHHDRWDSHRDMILRQGVWHGTALSFDEMGVFGKCGFGNEYVYDHGYGLVLYIARTYGEQKIPALARAASGWRGLSFGHAVQQVLGVGPERLHADWMAWMKGEYDRQLAALGELREGEVVAELGFSNQRPAFSPDGRRLAYLSTRRQEMGPPQLVVREMDSGEEEVVAGGV